MHDSVLIDLIIHIYQILYQMRSSRTSSARLDSFPGSWLSQDLTAMHIAGMRERNTAGGGALDAIAAFRWSFRWDVRGDFRPLGLLQYYKWNCDFELLSASSTYTSRVFFFGCYYWIWTHTVFSRGWNWTFQVQFNGLKTYNLHQLTGFGLKQQLFSRFPRKFLCKGGLCPAQVQLEVGWHHRSHPPKALSQGFALLGCGCGCAFQFVSLSWW